MAIVTMKRLRVLGMQSDRPALLEELQRLGCVEIGQVDRDLTSSDLPTLHSPDSAALNKARGQYQAAQQAMEILAGYSKNSGSFLDPRPVIAEKELFNQSNLDKAEEVITQITTAKQDIGNLQGEKTALLGKIEGLKPWESVDLPLDTGETANMTVQFGVLPPELDLNVFSGTLSQATELADLQKVGVGKDGQYVIFTCYNPVLDKALEVVKNAGFARTNFRGVTGTARDNLTALQSRVAEIDRTVAQKEEVLARFGEQRKTIQQYLDSVKQVIAREEAQSRLVDTENTFYLEGWVEAEKWPQVETLLSKYTAGWEVEEPRESDIPDVPVKLKNSKFSRPMSIVTEMYSLPAYNGIDPNPLMAPFFILFYGIMMADMGYGLLMMFGTQYVLNKAKPKGGMEDFCLLFRSLGVSTFFMGAITGGFFGDFLPQILGLLGMLPHEGWQWFWPPLFTPLGDTLNILMGSMVLGAIHVVTGMMISFNKKAKEGRFMDGVMDEGSWWLLFIGIGVGATSGNWAVAYAGAAALVLTQGRTSPSIIGKVVGGVGSLYNITSYFGDILSYARLMALMLAGSVIAQVFNTLGAIPGNVILFVVISVAGNSLNFALNLLGCFVHTLRLQCLEFFGKFYMDGGRAFRPLEMDTKYVDIQEQQVAS